MECVVFGAPNSETVRWFTQIFWRPSGSILVLLEMNIWPTEPLGMVITDCICCNPRLYRFALKPDQMSETVEQFWNRKENKKYVLKERRYVLNSHDVLREQAYGRSVHFYPTKLRGKMRGKVTRKPFF